MPTYLVTWEIDIIANSPREAAEEALAIQRNPDSESEQFTVREFDSEGTSVTIDLFLDEEFENDF